METEYAEDVTIGTLIWLESEGFEMNINDGQISEIYWKGQKDGGKTHVYQKNHRE